jgi:type III restriction enzyme
MSRNEFQFDGTQQYQLDAINSVVRLFEGQPKDSEALITNLIAEPSLPVGSGLVFDFDLSQEVGAVGNNLVLDRGTILENLRNVQDLNGLEISSSLASEGLDFDIEMETGTGKTYVYLRSIFELASKYNFKKFIILVPSVAIREGVKTSIRLMEEHLKRLYPSFPFDSAVYSGRTAEEVQSFATSTSVQILIMTIDSIKGDANNRIIHQNRDKLNGLRPIDYLRATRPFVILDEPQKMESQLALSALGELDPVATVRYSATHKKSRNVVYRLDPVDAHELGLVKQIVVADVRLQGADASPYIKLISVKRDSQWSARLELSVRNSSGQSERKEVSVRQDQDLSLPKLSNNPIYEGIRIIEFNLSTDGIPGSIELNSHGVIEEGEAIGGASSAIYREMLRETIREHFRKETQLQNRGIKVLSLIFVDKVASYLGEGTSYDTADGELVRWFDELFLEERAKVASWDKLLPQHPIELRGAYFSRVKRGKSLVIQDSTGKSKEDDDAYSLIMQDKARLLSLDEPVRFIFSHSALREGWDNPNVFQICVLREMREADERRQTLGRGLRLPVSATERGFERVADRGIASLTVIANESYKDFAKSLQIEYKDSGIDIGKVRLNEFARIPRYADDGLLTNIPLGFAKSQQIHQHLSANGYLSDGQVTQKFLPDTVGFSLGLPAELAVYEQEVIDLIRRATLDRFVRPMSKRKSRTLSKTAYMSPEFESFWESISQRSTFRVAIDRYALVNSLVSGLKSAPRVEALRIEVTKAGVKVLRGGAKSEELAVRNAELRGTYDLPDIISELQNDTSLTRATIVDALVQSGRLSEFIANPNDFIALVKRVFQGELSRLIVNGIQYERISGSIYELRELQKDGEEEKDRFLDQMYKVQNASKTDFDYVVYDSEVEREFAEKLDSREDVKFFMKLPPKFKVSTPVGDYNPDWAIIKHVEGEDRIYMIRETKSSLQQAKLRPLELAKIRAARQHFKAIGIDDYEVSAPENWNL